MAFAVKLQMLLTSMFMLSGSVEALQLNQGDAQIPDVAEVLQKPHEVMNEISTNVDALTVSLSEVRQQHTAQVAKQKADLEQKLAAQKAGNARIAETNEKTAVEISKWKEANQQLRWRASGLRKKSDELRSTLKIMLANMSYAQEFTDNALGDANQKLRNASEVQILFDLDAKEAERHAELAHAESLHAISATSIAMLEVGAKLTRKPSNAANDLLKMLSSALNELSVEQNASLASLQAQFDTLFHKGQERRASLLSNQTKLNETRSSALELNQRLHAAVDHLTKVNNGLEAQVASTRTFLETLSQRALPGTESRELVPKKVVADQTVAFRQALPKAMLEHKVADKKTEASETKPKKTNLRADAAKAATESDIPKTKEVSPAVQDSSRTPSWLSWVHNAKDRLLGKLH